MPTDSTVLSDLSDSLAAAVEKAAASVVTVSARRRLAASGVAWTADGAVLTSDHVLEREDDIKVTLPDGSEHAATIAGRDPGSDLAVLRLVGVALTAAEHALEARVGNLVLAVGRPTSEGPMASFGVISTIGGPWRTFRGTEVGGYIRSDTTFYPGFSGGPLIDVAGRVVGINSSRLGRGAGLTLPVAAAALIADDLLKQGKVRRAYLGISSQTAKLPASLAAKLGGQETGLLVVAVETGSPAELGGLLIGDILVALAGKPVAETDDLQAQLTPALVGKPTALTVLRGGVPTDLSVTVGERK
jgi:S1-C subfamily serine protease